MDEIVAALEALETDGSFTAEHTVPASALRLAVGGAGPIAFPLKPAAVQSLIEVAEPARFGWREKTLLDKKYATAGRFRCFQRGRYELFYRTVRL